MNPAFRSLLLLVLLVLGAVGAQSKWERVEVPSGGGLLVNAFGGANVRVSVTNNGPSTFSVTTADYDNLVSKASGTIATGITYEMVPRRVTRTLEKKNGIPVDGRLSEAYLAYEDGATGVRVYFYDTLDSKQNHTVFLVVPALPPPIAEQVTPDPDPLRAPGLDPEASSAPAPSLMKQRDRSDPAIPPAWSLVGETMLYGGRTLVESVTREAARWGLRPEDYVDERAWIEKQRQHGSGREQEYEEQSQVRQQRRSSRERASIQRLRESILRSQVEP